MRLQLVGKKHLRQSYNQIFETPSGIKVAKTKHGYYPVTRDGQINKKRRYAGKIDEYEIWEYVGKQRISVSLKEVEK